MRHVASVLLELTRRVAPASTLVSLFSKKTPRNVRGVFSYSADAFRITTGSIPGADFRTVFLF